jgi:hypothetical protein
MIEKIMKMIRNMRVDAGVVLVSVGFGWFFDFFFAMSSHDFMWL